MLENKKKGGKMLKGKTEPEGKKSKFLASNTYSIVFKYYYYKTVIIKYLLFSELKVKIQTSIFAYVKRCNW